jgi:hypothetical protein
VNEELHLIIRMSEDGTVYATSPQAPGLMIGRSSLKLLRYDLADVLSFHFDDTGPFNVVEHLERHFVLGDGELVIRVAQDADVKDREAAARRILEAASVPEQARSLVSTANDVDESVYVCAVPSDTLGWLRAQIQSGETVNVAVPIAEGFLFTMPVAADVANTLSGWGEWTSASPETRLSDVMQKTRVVTPQHSGSLELC